MSRQLDRIGLVFVVLLAAAAIVVPVLSLATPASSPFNIPPYLVQLLGKYLCYAILAVALDLVWGYCGILSLGHGAFFALGGYAMGMYLMRQIGTRGVYANPILPDFMVFLNWKELPVAWWGFNWFPYAMLMVRAGSGSPGARLRLVRLPLARDRGLSLDHHPGDDVCAVQGILPQRFRLRRQQRPDRLQGSARLLAAVVIDQGGAVFGDAIALILAYLVARAIIGSKYGKALVAIRDAESRMRFLGYRVENYKLFAFVVSAVMAGVAGALYVPQVGIINPSEFAPGQFDRGGDMGRGRRPWDARRRRDRRDRGQFRENLVHRRLSRILALRARRTVRSRHAVPAPRPARPCAQRPARARRRRPEAPALAVEEGADP